MAVFIALLVPDFVDEQYNDPRYSRATSYCRLTLQDHLVRTSGALFISEALDWTTRLQVILAAVYGTR